MLKKTFKTDTSLITNLFVSSEDNASDTDFVFQNILDIESLANINSIIDFESIEYKHVNNSVEFDIFFLQYLLKDEIDQMKNYVEPSFNDYSNKVLSIKTNVKSELFEIRDDNDLRAVQFDGTLELTRGEINDNKPYVVVDPLVEIRKNYPTKPGYPHFYNTFAFPFWGKKDVWVDLKYGFNNKTYTYNSFLIIEIYDTYEVEKQKKITTIPVYVSDRYLFKEKRETKTYNVNDGLGNLVESVIEGITQKRPVFNLSEGIDGYSFFFLKKYIKSDFYVKFYFWDALNGKKIQFIPSGKSNNRKKWLQDVEIFNQKDLYLKYELDYTNKKYKIFDLNNTTGNFDIEVDKIDLYEFAYDDYWSKFFVGNTQPTNTTTTEPVSIYTDILPFKNKINGKYSLTDTKYVTVKEGIRGEHEVVDVVIVQEFISIPNLGRFNIPVAYGNYYGYFITLANNIDVKTIGLLNIRDIKSGITDIKGSKKRIESVTLKNVNKDKGFLIESLSLENVKFTSNERSIDLSNTSTSSYAIQNYPTGTNTYAETHVLPKISNKNTFSILDTLFREAFEQYKFYVSDISVPRKPVVYNQDIYDDLNQRIFANMSALGEQINLPINTPSPGDAYTPQNLTQKLVTEPLFKEQTFTLIASTISNKILYDEEILVSLDLVFGKLGLFYAGIIKEMNINGTLVINYIESDNSTATTQKLSIPINIDIK